MKISEFKSKNPDLVLRKATLCFLLRDDEVLLAMKKRGFGVGKWNGVGGKVMEGESIEEAMKRECREEIGVALKELEEVGELSFILMVERTGTRRWWCLYRENGREKLVRARR